MGIYIWEIEILWEFTYGEFYMGITYGGLNFIWELHMGNFIGLCLGDTPLF